MSKRYVFSHEILEFTDMNCKGSLTRQLALAREVISSKPENLKLANEPISTAEHMRRESTNGQQMITLNCESPAQN